MTHHTDIHTDVGSNNIYTDKDPYDTTNTKLKIRSTFFTINNYTETDENCLRSIVHGKENSRYLVYQQEVGTEGTPHLQGFMYFYNNIELGTLNKQLPRAHFEKPKNIKACILYCKKERTRIGGPYEFGKMPEQGRRTDLETAAKNFLEKPLAEFVANDPMTYVRFHKGLHALKTVTETDRKEAPTVYWFWGESGAGKTRTAFESHEKCYMKNSTKWWDGYEQGAAIIIDDFDGKWPFRDLLRLLDRYPYQGETKGGHVKINSSHIYITCDEAPQHWWSDNELKQILRRITEVRRFVVG